MSKVSEAVDNRTDSPSQPPGETTPRRSPLRMAGLAFLRQREATVLVVAIALIVYFSVSSSNFYGTSNLSTWLSQDSAYIMIIAVGEVFLLICGEIDLSVGFIFTFSPFLMHYLIDFYGFPGWLAIIVWRCSWALAVGWINGFLTVSVGLPSFITTLGTGFILLGLVNTTSHAEAVPIPARRERHRALDRLRHLVRVHLGRHPGHPGPHPADPDPVGPAHDLGRRQPARRPGSGHQGQADQVRQLHDRRASWARSSAFRSPSRPTPSTPPPAATRRCSTRSPPRSSAARPCWAGSGTVLGAALGAIVLGTLIDGFSILGVSANPLDIIFGGAILIAMIANVQLARLREAGRSV